jgi:hypothetical protein
VQLIVVVQVLMEVLAVAEVEMADNQVVQEIPHQ